MIQISNVAPNKHTARARPYKLEGGPKMEDKCGEFYSKGYCTASNEDCNNNLKGTCGVCSIGGTYRNILSQLIFQENDSALTKISRNL